MPKLRKWFRDRIQGAHRTRSDPKGSEPPFPPGLPVLPSKRQHVLTPSPSHVDLNQNVTSKSAFFQRLPPELRYQIYIDAFGGRIVHMDLRFDHPALPGPGHAGFNAGNPWLRDYTAPRAWIWQSSVCHRNPLLEANADQCRTGSANTTCSLYAGEFPGKCFLGVMGWLLSCRQAYAEGIDILYRTNKIHISSVILTRQVPLLLLPQRLGSITKLEFIWDLAPFIRAPLYPSAEDKAWSTYDNLVQIVASSFPSLEQLYISIETGSFISNPIFDNIETYERRLLPPIDAMVRELGPKLHDCQIAPPRSLYTAMMYRAESVGARTDSGGQGALRYERFWRPVTVPQAEHSKREYGYWIRRGIEDTPIHLRVGYAFSSTNSEGDLVRTR